MREVESGTTRVSEVDLETLEGGRRFSDVVLVKMNCRHTHTSTRIKKAYRVNTGHANHDAYKGHANHDAYTGHANHDANRARQP